MQKKKLIFFLDVVEKLDEGEVNEQNCIHLEGNVLKKQGGCCL